MNTHTYRKSLFAEVEKHKTTNKKNIIHRLVFVAMINENPRQDRRSSVAEYYEQFISKLQKSSVTEAVSGTLLLYPSCVLHLVEASYEVLQQILKDLSDMEKSSDSLLKDSRVLVVSHCLPGQTFPSWGYWFLKVPLKLEDAFRQKQAVEVLVPDSLALIYKLCASLRNPRGNCEGHDAQQQTSLLEEESVIHLCQSKVLHSPTTYLKAYTKPVNTVMESELVWPTHRRLYWWRM